MPGSSLLLAMTDAARPALGHRPVQLWRTSTWARCSPGSTRRRARRAPRRRSRAELARDARGQLLCPPAGPATDPAFDNKLLAPAIERYDRARTALAAAEDGLEADDRLGELTAAEREIRALVREPHPAHLGRGVARPRPAARAARGRACRRALDARPLVVHRPPRPGRRGRAPAAAPRRRGHRGEQARHARARAGPAGGPGGPRRPAGDGGAAAGRGGVRRGGHGCRDGVQRGQAAQPAPAGHRPHGRPAAPGRAGQGVPLAGRQAAVGRVRAVRGGRAICVVLRDRRQDGPRQGARARFGAGEGRPALLHALRARAARRPEAARPGGDTVDARRAAGREPCREQPPTP